MPFTFDQGLLVDIQPMDQWTLRQPCENGSRSTAGLQDALCVTEAGLIEEVRAKLAGPVCLLGVAFVPVHALGG